MQQIHKKENKTKQNTNLDILQGDVASGHEVVLVLGHANLLQPLHDRPVLLFLAVSPHGLLSRRESELDGLLRFLSQTPLVIPLNHLHHRLHRPPCQQNPEVLIVLQPVHL